MAPSIRFPGTKKKEEAAYSAVEIDPSKSSTDVSSRGMAVPGWPNGAQHVRTFSAWIIADILLLLMPIAFIALAGLAYKLDGQELSRRGKYIQDVILLGPTLFPLAFAALGGRSLKKIALWRAERGTTLGFLEHVIGSQSLVAAVGHAITLHSLNFLTLGLLALWALSPLGGQSALRLLNESNSTITEHRPIFYANVDAPSEFPKEPYNEDAVNRVNALVMTTLMTLDNLEFAPVDTWNHPKIPRLPQLEEAAAKNSTDRSWYTIDTTDSKPVYASLAGVDVINVVKSGATNFTIPYEYMYFNCEFSASNNFTAEKLSNSVTITSYLHTLNNATQLESGSQFFPNFTFVDLTKRSFFFYAKTNGPKPEALLYGSRGISSTSMYLFECSMKSVMVEANVMCKEDTCGVERLRRLNVPRTERIGSDLPYDVVNDAFHTLSYFIRHLVKMGGESSLFKPNPIDAYIYGESPWVNDNGTPPQKNWTEYVGVPQKSIEMSQRLTRFLNTYWDASRWPLAMARTDPFGQSNSTWNHTSGEPNSFLAMNKTEGTVTHQIIIYRANATWVALLVICSSVLLLLGIFSLIISFQTSVPDIFDYVSSFTRDNRFIRTPEGGSSIDGADRARLLRKLPIQLGDTDAGSQTGYIAMRSVEGTSDCQNGRVRRDRLYR